MINLSQVLGINLLINDTFCVGSSCSSTKRLYGVASRFMFASLNSCQSGLELAENLDSDNGQRAWGGSGWPSVWPGNVVVNISHNQRIRTRLV